METDIFTQHATRVSSRSSGALVTVAHASSEQFDADAVLAAAPEEAFALVYRLSDMPAHDFWNADGFSRVPATARGTLQVVDLAGGASSRFESGFDNLHLSIHRQALSAVSEQNDLPPVRFLAVPDAWETRDPMFAALTVGLVHALGDPGAIDSLVIDHLLHATLLHVATTYGGIGSAMPKPRGALTGRQIARAKDLLASDLPSSPPIAQVAMEVGTSPSQFSRSFRAATGLSPSEWLLKHRVQRARDLLRTTDLPLVDVAFRSGFADQSHFTRAFSKIQGVPPGAWRRSERRR